MSDHEDTTGNSGYSTSVPELDDHRHNRAASASREEDRPRRGTFDSLYGARINLGGSPDELLRSIRVRDFEEEAVVDEDAGEASPNALRRSRRPTVESVRSVSPPNSVKAFAEARRQECWHVVLRDQGRPQARVGHGCSPTSPHRPPTAAERRTVAASIRCLDDTASPRIQQHRRGGCLLSIQDERNDDKLYIDFDYLENFMKAERKPSMSTGLLPPLLIPTSGPSLERMPRDSRRLQLSMATSWRCLPIGKRHRRRRIKAQSSGRRGPRSSQSSTRAELASSHQPGSLPYTQPTWKASFFRARTSAACSRSQGENRRSLVAEHEQPFGGRSASRLPSVWHPPLDNRGHHHPGVS